MDQKLSELGKTLDLMLTEVYSGRPPHALSVVVVHDQTTVFSRSLGFASLASSASATDQTVFRVASITKLFTATMLMQLRDAGKLCLDDPIEKYVPTFHVQSRFPDARPVTFRQVVSHTSGLPHEAPLAYFQTLQFPTIDEVLASLANTEMVFPAMSEYKYSNLGYAILGHALELIADKPYAEYVSDHILQPLGMINSGYSLREEMKEHLATGYEVVDGTLRATTVPADLGAFAPAGGLYTSTADLVRFISLQFHDGPAMDRHVLGGTTLREMHAPVFMDSDWRAGIGLGWDLRRIAGFPAVAHDGGMPGFTSNITVIPALRLGVATCASTRTEPWSISRQCLEALAPRLSEATRTMEAVAPETGWHRYAGRYAWRDRSSLRGRSIDVQVRGTQLVAIYRDASDDTEMLLRPAGDERFRIQATARNELNGELATFIRTEDGQVSGMRIGSYWLERIGEVSEG